MPILLTPALRTAPDPVQQGGLADLTLVVNNQGTKKVTCTSVRVALPVGTSAKTLVTDLKCETRPQAGWSVDVQGAWFVLTPPGGSVEVGAEGVSFSFLGLRINQQPGTATVNVVVAGTVQGATPTTETTPINVSKFPPGFALSELTVTERFPLVGGRTKLLWRGSNASYELSYAPDGITPKTLTNLPPTGGIDINDLSRAGTVNFYLKATSPGGGDAPLVVERTTSVTVRPLPARITNFAGAVTEEGNVRLEWETADCHHCSLTGFPAQLGPKEKLDPFPPTSLAYTLTSYNVADAEGDKRTVRFSLAEGPSVGVGVNPFRIALTEDSRRAYLTHGPRYYGTMQPGNVISVIDTQSTTVKQLVTVGSMPHSVAMGQDAAFITCVGDASIWAVDHRTLKSQRVCSVAANPTGLAIDGTRAYLCNGAQGLEVFDITPATWKTRFVFPVSHALIDVAVRRGNNRVCLVGSTSLKAGMITIVDLPVGGRKETRFAAIPIAAVPMRCAISPDGSRLIVACGVGGERKGLIVVIDLVPETPAIISQIPIDGNAVGIAFLGDTAYVSVMFSSDVLLVKLADGTSAGKLAVNVPNATDLAGARIGQRLFLPLASEATGTLATAIPGKVVRS